MCTVSFIPRSNNDFILTSNRDESPNRNTIAPQLYKIDGVDLLYPKDEVAGGTWIGASNKKRLICLLNGGFVAHQPAENYRMSRGVVVTDLLTSEDVVTKVKEYDFIGVEPFTIILVDWNINLVLYELVWDGDNIHFSEKPIKPTIWSSSLLYSEKVKKKRETWFSEFMDANAYISAEDIIDFHKTAGDGDKETSLIMNRVFVKTKSITEFSKKDERYEMRYEDLATNKVYLKSL